jgi:hypothetical protein
MLRDVFYYGQKPNVHAREKPAKNLDDARQQATTDHFWIVNEFCDYTNFDWDFDFEFLDDDQVWTENHNNIWPSQHQKDSGTWLCPKKYSDLVVYRTDVNPIIRKNIKTVNWKINELIDETTFDFSWHPDPTSPPYIYAWGCRYYPPTHKPVVEYIIDNASEYKYMDGFVELLPDSTKWKILESIDKNTFDFRWRPDPKSPPYIYVWGNQHYSAEVMPTIEYSVEGATERKYIDHKLWHIKLSSDKTNFKVYDEIENFDYSWRPDPGSPPYIYVWGNKWIPAELQPTLEYHCPGATEKKYMTDLISLSIQIERWKIPDYIDKDSFDFTWRPDPREPNFIYEFGTQWGNFGGPTYYMEGATQIKYITDIKAKVKSRPNDSNWKILDNIDKTKFDFSWIPDPTSPPYIYAWGSKHIDASTSPAIEYIVPGATEYKYMSELIEVLPNFENWIEYQNIDRTKFDFSWRPNPKEPPYIYAWGNKFVPVEMQSTLEYRVSGAIDYKYMGDVEVLPQHERWVIHQEIDTNKFDLCWRPDPREPAYIYVWGNKYIPAELQPTLEYHCPGATEKKYMQEHVPVIQEKDRWTIIQEIDTTKFDLAWRPDPREPAYIYIWGNKYISGEVKPTLIYKVPNATETKYMGNIDVLPELDRWKIYENIDTEKFDLSWRPNPNEPAYIYVWGNKYIAGELQPTLEYYCDDAIEKKYMGNAPVTVQVDRWRTYHNVDTDLFDMTWRPDPREPAYIYVWGNKYVEAELRPTLEYITPGATEKKYMQELVPLKPDYKNYQIYYPVTNFDFTWMPDPREPAYIYTWGNQHVPAEVSPTIEYIVEGATERKFMGIVQVTANYTKWQTYQKTRNFDYSWVPDPTSEPYIYIWGNKYIPGEKIPTVTYTVEGATEYKYMGNDVDVEPEWDRWKIYLPVDKSFDFSWRPNPNEPPFIYVWGNKHIKGELQSTLEYIVPGASEKKYMGNVEIVPQWDNWTITQQPSNFDFTWMPDPREPAYIYVWGNKYIPGEKKPTVTYHTPGATEIKYMGNNLEVEPEWDKWKILIPVDKSSFDFTWRPDPNEPPFIYVWGNQSNNAETEPTIEYYSDSLDSEPVRKYMDNMVAKTLPMSECWEICVPVEEFDFSWRPNPGAPPYIYVFGNQWNKAEVEHTILYKVPGATEYNYINDIVAKVSPMYENWKVLMPVDNFDFSWRPNPHDPPYIYVFGNQWNPVELQHTLEYHVHGATEYKYVDIKAYLKANYNNGLWKNLIPVEYFDYSWVPDPREPPLIYVFGNKWNDANTEPSVEYHMEGATERKYLDILVATPSVTMKNWSVYNNDDLENFDFSWRPNPYSPPQIYQWEDNGPRYTVPDAVDVVYMPRTNTQVIKKKDIPKYYIQTTLDDLIKQHPDEEFWALNPDLTYEGFDFNWKPNSQNFRHVNVFGNENSKDTQTYYINGPMYMSGYREYNYVTDQQVYIKETNLSIFFIDRNNNDSKHRFEELQKRFPNIIKTRFFNSWVETISRCIRKSKTNLFWVVNSEYDYSNFEFNFYPSPWQMQMVHVFGTQWSHWGHTYLINGTTFNDDTKYVKIIEHLQNLNFVKDKTAKATDCLYDVYLIDHGNKETSTILENLINKTNKEIKIVKYVDSYLSTLQKLLTTLENKKEHYIWICSSVCNYDNFDFTYICDPFAKENLHVFASDRQKFGDTFLLDVNKLRSVISDLTYLEDFNKVNYVTHNKAQRLAPPIYTINDDTHSNSWKIEYDFPYAVMKNSDNDVQIDYREPLSLWASHTKNIEILTTGGSVIVIPKQVKSYIQDQLYDYPYISKANKLINSKPLDIVFLSNGESQADENYEHLIKVTKGLPNRVVRVDGVNGRVQAYQAAAEASQTQWMFTVFAKLKVDNDFDWNWQPDRLQSPKHYIFNAINPLNGLIYGHQAMIAYNKKLTLNNNGQGLDFTLDDPHTVVDMLSGIAEFNTDPYSTWRTAFREAIKLKNDYKDVSYERLQIWLTVAEGKYAKNCLQGANDAVEYYDSVSGDIDQLKLSYEWDWLKDYYDKKYK